MFAAIRSVSLIISVLCAANVFFHVRSLSYMDALTRGKKALIALPFALLTLYFMRDAFSTAWMMGIHVSLILVLSDLVRAIFKRLRRGEAVLRAIRRGAAFLAALLVCLYGYFNMKTVRNTRYTVETDKFSGEIKVAVISDTHLSNALDAFDALSLVDRAKDGGADVLILAGDIADEGTELTDFETFAAGLTVRSFPMGKYFVFGNHDGARYGGSVSVSDMEEALTKAGVTVLTDESVLVNGYLRVAGRKNAADRSRLSAEALLKNANIGDEFVLMIDHQPAETSLCAAAGVDLLVSGHTHNGQIWPVNLISKAFRINEIEYGQKNVNGMQAVVSSGASGWGCAFRTAGRSEIVWITVSGNGQKSAETSEN